MTRSENWCETHFCNSLVLKILNDKIETINILEKTKPAVKPQGMHDWFKHCMEKEDEEEKEKKNQGGSTRYKTEMWRTKRNGRSKRDEGEQKIEERDKEEKKKIIRSVILQD